MKLNDDFNQLLITIMNVMIIPLLPVVSAFIIAFIKKKTSELEKNIKDQTMLKYIDIAESAILSSVATVNQIYVDNLKKESGILSAEEQKTAFTMAKDRILKILGETGIHVLQEVYNDADTWLNNRIEYYVNQQKSNLVRLHGRGCK